MHEQLSSGVRDKMSGLSFHLCPFILLMRSVETAQICRLARAFADRICNLSTKSLELAHYILGINVSYSFLKMLYYRLKRLVIMPQSCFVPSRQGLNVLVYGFLRIQKLNGIVDGSSWWMLADLLVNIGTIKVKYPFHRKMANSEVPDQMLHNAASDLGLY